MKLEEQRNQLFYKLEKKFSKIKHQLPEHTQWKLQYIIDKINKVETQFPTLQSRIIQAQDLQYLNTTALIIVFNSIAQALLQQLESNNKAKCKIKYSGFLFNFWNDCTFSIHKKQIQIDSKSKVTSINFSGALFMDKIQNFTIVLKHNQDIKFWLKFENQEDMEFCHNLFYRHKAEFLKEQSSKRKSIHISKSKSKLNEKIGTQSFDFNYEIKIKKRDFILKMHKIRPEIKIQLTIDIIDQLEKIASSYFCQKNWNTSVQSVEILDQIDTNIFMVRRIYKWDGKTEKQSMSLVEFQRISQNCALLIDQSFEKESMGKFSIGYFKSVILIQIKDGKINISLQSSIDDTNQFKKQESRQFLASIYADMAYFQDYLKISAFKELSERNMFTKLNQDFVISEIQKESSSDENKQDFLEMKPIPSLSQKQTMTTDKVSSHGSNHLDDTQQKKFLKLRPKRPTTKITQEYLQMIAKEFYLGYYLQKKFTKDEQLKAYDTTLPSYCLEELLDKGNEYQINSDKELVCINFELIQNQKSTLTFVIKKIGANLISGKSVMNISLPVDIFQSRALLQRSAASFGYAPFYLMPICEQDSYQQMKNILAFISSIPTLQLLMFKPFNPILGQTFQAYIKGIPIYYEQISHHPPISSYYMKCQQFTLYGNLIAFADVGLNSAVGGNSGAMHIIFKNGNHFECYFPPCEISGLIYGRRKFRAYGKGFLIQKKHHLFCEFSIQKQKKGLYENVSNQKMRMADVIGGIFQVNDRFIQKFSALPSVKKFGGLEKQDVIKKHSHIKGVWFQTMYVDDQPIEKGKCYALDYQEPVLPSDSNFRLDILYHRIGNQQRSQTQKEILQILQRSDKKLRQSKKR